MAAVTVSAQQIPSWAQIIVTAHNAVASGHVSHAARIESDRYFCWQEDDRNDLNADNAHAERAVTGYTDLFTKREFDPWAEGLETAFDTAGISWQKTGVTYEPDTGFFHHSWDWEVAY